MGLRFGKRITLGKFITLNISKSGISTSFGVRGARITTGPRGTHATVGIPGSGISYTKKLGGSASPKRERPPRAEPAADDNRFVEPAAPVEEYRAPAPGLFAPKHEKAFYQGLEAFRAGDDGPALGYLLEAAPYEPGAALLAAALLSNHEPEAITLLESVVLNDVEFPTELMERYGADEERLLMRITEFSEAEIALDGIGATLLLAEAYQAQQWPDDAIGILEELNEVADEPAVTLSLCELYAANGHWEGIVDIARQLPVVDAVTYEINYIYGLALQQQGLHDAARTVFSDALRRKKDQDETLTIELLYARALSYEASGKHAQARKEFEKVYMLDTGFRDIAQRLDLTQEF